MKIASILKWWRVHGLSTAAVSLVLLSYGWTFSRVGGSKAMPEARDYYSYLTDAIVSGHLYFKVQPDPRLAELKNPWDHYQGIPRLHDATYYHGRYYLYFGITPFLILFAPWHLVFHSYLSEGAGTCLFATAGFLLGLGLLHWLERRLSRPLADGWRALLILVWGWSSYVFLVMQNSTVYAVPITGAFACLLLAMAAAATSWLGRGCRWTIGSLACASLAWGLAVGSRPNYLLSLPVLAIPLIAQMHARWKSGSRSVAMTMLAAAIVPAACVGAFLAWYNYARFGSCLEFGVHYQFAAGDQRNLKLAALGSLPANLKAYLFDSGRVYAHFPFVTGDGGVIGLIPWAPFITLGGIFPLICLWPAFRREIRWLPFGFCLWLVGASHLVGIGILPFANDRYNVDYAPAWTLLAIGVAGGVLSLSTRWNVFPRWMFGGMVLLLAGFSISRNLLLVAELTADARITRLAAAVAERGVALVEPTLGVHYGPQVLRLDLHVCPADGQYTLVANDNGRDRLFLERVEVNRYRLGFVHSGNVPFYGQPFLVPSSQGETTFAVNLGCFYPPPIHPFFAGWDSADVAQLRQIVHVTMKGAEVLQGYSFFYPSDLFQVQFGPQVQASPALPPVSRNAWEPTAAFAANFFPPGWCGPVRLTLRFPAFSVARYEPLVTSGRHQQADLVYAYLAGPHTLRLGSDCSAGGAIETDDIEFDPQLEHTVDISYGGLFQEKGTPSLDFALRFDGKLCLSIKRPTFPTKPYAVIFGHNAYGLSSTAESFSGSMTVGTPPDPDYAVRGAEWYRDASPGYPELTVRFVPITAKVSEPLLVYGQTGRADMIFVSYEDADHIRIGIDHWGIGAIYSEPIRIQSHRVYHLQVLSAPLGPPAHRDPGAGVATDDKIEVRLDGRPVAVAPWRGYTCTADQVFIGRNPLGGSTCIYAFSGEILSVARTVPAR